MLVPKIGPQNKLIKKRRQVNTALT